MVKTRIKIDFLTQRTGRVIVPGLKRRELAISKSSSVMYFIHNDMLPVGLGKAMKLIL